MTDLDEMMSEHALRRLSTIYAAAVDAIDEAALLSVFHDGAELVVGLEDGKLPGAAMALCAFIRDHLTKTQHFATNHAYVVDGDEARGEISVLTYVAAGSRSTLSGGRYRDRYVRREGRWGIMRREYAEEWRTRSLERIPDDVATPI